MNKKAYLVLENGTVFEGFFFGAEADSIGELVFNTGMCGYEKTLTDKSYFGQIVMQTFPLVGNYGIIDEDIDGECALKGYVVREQCEVPSNFRCNKTLDEFLKEKGITGIYGIDTRAVTKIIREQGVMNAKICKEIPKDFTEIKNYKIFDAVNNTATKKKEIYSAQNAIWKVTLIDYGEKGNIIEELVKRGCTVTTVPHSTSAEEIFNTKPDGILLSNGGGNPSDNEFEIFELKKLIGKIPIFGIGLGHQILSIALGARTYKHKYGHRGANQPVINKKSKRTYITTQNHGYAVENDSVTKGTISFVNANDETCEGIEYSEYKAFSVQFYPITDLGPHDTSFLYEHFVTLMEGK